MITGVHTMFYSAEPAALRAFLRDTLCFPFTDVGDGWLIFDLPSADMGCHPADPAEGVPSGRHDISFFCDDIQKTVAELKARGVEFVDEIADHGYGLVTHFRAPGGMELQLYQPRYEKKPAVAKSGRSAKPARRKQPPARKSTPRPRKHKRP
jgi:predicted enzyme related to lactoylglutathione lyase